MPQGEKRGSELDLFDYTYDGNVSAVDGRLCGGLGQLVDGDEGLSNFRLDPQALGLRGYEWVGWKSDAYGQRPLEIVFRFDAVRNFTQLRLHCNNQFSKDVRVFEAATVSFSVGGERYASGPVVEYRYVADNMIEYARSVIVPLENGVGRYVRLWLYFDARWMMISEVQFFSGKYT